MHARSALFDLYGDHLRARGGTAPVSALVRLLAPLDVAAPAVRTTVSRMVRQGWLVPQRTGAGPGYALTARAARRLDEAGRRVYRTGLGDWDGRWHVLVLGRVPHRARRERLRASLGFFGYGPLDETTWLAPRPGEEVAALLAHEQVTAERFSACYDGDPAVLARRVWALDALGAAYRDWQAEAAHLVAAAGPAPSDEVAFATRSRLLHEWRKFLFRDPGLPQALLPTDWPGTVAAAYFDDQAARLLPAAARFVDSCLEGPGA